jgi:MFS family permease
MQTISEAPREDKPMSQASQVQVSLRACVREGVAAQVMIGIFDYYLVPLALLFSASTAQIGLLIALPQLLAAFSQIFAVKSVHFVGSRKGLLTIGVGLQAAFLLPIPFLAVLHLPHRLELLLIFVSIFRVLGSLMGPAWGSIVSDYLPENKRGKFFGRRAQIISISGVIAMSFWGVFLSMMNKVSPGWGLFFVFLSAALCRFLSYYYMKQLVELPHESTAEDEKFTFWMFIKRMRVSNFVRFILFISAITFATQLCAGYFSVYMLKELHFGYFHYMAVNLASVIAGLLSFPMWGRHADLIGNARILKLTSLLIPFIPILWMFYNTPWALVGVEMISGFIWGGFNLCATNFIYDAVTPSKRVQCLCYFNLINGGALFGGAALGGLLATWLPPINGSSLITLFLISGGMRMLAYLALAHAFKEVRPSYHNVRSSQLFMSVLGVRPLVGRNIEY